SSVVGFGFIFIELSLLQKVIFFLGVPSFGYFFTICSFLIFMALGSIISSKIPLSKAPHALVLVVVATIITTVGLNALWPEFIRIFSHYSVWIKFGALIPVIAPLAFLLGLPFPLGIKVMESTRPGGVAIQWAVNTATSTLGAAFALISWMFMGFVP
ncbi:unnamed protein product, partial [marine sediment metagenome]